MVKDFFSGAKGVKRIVLIAVAAVLVAIIIAGNIVLQMFSKLLHPFFAGGSGGDTSSEEAKNALGSADELGTEIAEESIVLLKNEENFLPLDKGTKVNFFGWSSTDSGFLLVGGGSGGVGNAKLNADKAITLYEAFDDYGEDLYNKELAKKYQDFNSYDADGTSFQASCAPNAVKNPAANWYNANLIDQALGFSSTAIVVLGRFGTENGGSGELVSTGSYSNGAYLELTTEEKAIFQTLDDNNFDVVVLLNTTNPIELKFLEEYDSIKACMYVGIPGQSGARAIPELLYGQKVTFERDKDTNAITNRTYEPISPSGRISDTLAYSWQEHNPTYVNATSTSNNGTSLAYAEGIYIGYKWYETADVAGYYAANNTSYDKVVQFPFGFGLSYTTFKQEIVEFGYMDGKDVKPLSANAKLDKDTTYAVTVRVTNTGDRVGRDVVQLYYTAPYTEGGIEKSSINLLAFDKTALLKPQSESATESVQDITLTFKAYDMASYDDYDKNKNGYACFELDGGKYTIKLMENAHKAIDDTHVLECPADGIQYEKDPVTGKTVENRFTGDNAYADMPIDGSTGATGGVTYLSRENAFENFAALKKVGGTTQKARTAANYDYDGYDNADISNIDYGQENNYWITTLEDGSKPASNDLTGGSGARDLKFDYDLMKDLQNWDNEELWNDVLNQLTQAEIRTLTGQGGFQTAALLSVAKPRCFDTDGPAGFNNATMGGGADWTVFPAETLTGCSWSQRLTYNLGQSQGQIGNATGVQGWYAPGVNLHRSVYNQRNYEYYSEDGVLSGKLAAETVRGAKEKGLYCYVKHFAISDNGQNAGDWYEWLTEQALRETYLRPFEITVKEGGANAMMSAFNKIGAVWAGYNHALLTDILRTEWGFHGSVITDYCNPNCYMESYGKALKAGNDLWLRATNGDTSITFSNVGQAYGARESAKSLLYTYIDTNMAAKQYQDKVDNNEIEDKYTVTLGPSASAAAYSPVFAALWAVLDIALIAGVGLCVLFMFIPKGKKPVTEEAGDATEPTESDDSNE